MMKLNRSSKPNNSLRQETLRRKCKILITTTSMEGTHEEANKSSLSSTQPKMMTFGMETIKRETMCLLLTMNTRLI